MILLLLACTSDPNEPEKYSAALLSLATSFAAQEGCSCRFVMGRDEAFCEEWIRVSPDIARITVDEQAKTVTSSALMGWTRTARFDPFKDAASIRSKVHRMSLHEKRIAALAALAGVLFPATSDAVEWAPGAGMSAGVTFFQKKLLFNFTAEAYVTAGWRTHEMEYDCHPYPDMTAFGPMGAVSFVKGSPRFIVAAIGGTPPIRDSALGVGGEAGVVFGASEEPGPGLHLGANVVYNGLTADVRSEALRETSVTAGLRYLPPYGSWGEQCAFAGRPRRDADGRRMNRECVPGWAKEAQDEADSVLAFLDLAQALLERDAPPHLVDAAIDAAEDEIRHALLCAAEAETVPSLPAFAPRAVLRGREALDRIATESFHDGWINEGLAAHDARTRVRVARGSARRTLAVIARDEARHARLGRAVTAWAVERGGRVALG